MAESKDRPLMPFGYNRVMKTPTMAGTPAEGGRQIFPEMEGLYSIAVE